ncbi:mandelate racemase/muconate lactonizing enzyme family protein [Microbacterium thalassium]|uniref:mandelate racemase/muconate lactonizing enzyme family protein n=1 Tax=Microbacterium TaxID=33882 RepID=UPI00146EAC8C|nr:mandelate racemase/muconate lactonizing enzyme family protein [Microbacterium thalassium]
MSKIVAVEAATAVIPLDSRTGFSTRTVDDRHYGLVRVHTDDGLTGIGFCYAGHAAGHLVAHAVLDLLAPVLLGEDPQRVSGLWGRMYSESLLHGRTGSVMRAISALDIALWDRNARAAGQPLWKHLGGMLGDSVPAYASGGYYLDGKGPDQLAQETAEHVANGFTAVKIKVGRVAVADDVTRLAAVRDAVGAQVEVMLDANNAWPDLWSAVRAAEAFAPYRPAWLEEPFSPDHARLHSTLAAHTPIPIATGEIEAGRWRHAELLAGGGVQVLQTDAAVCGGITEWRRIAAIADAQGVSMAPHWFHDLHVHLVGSTPNASWVEFFADDQVLNFRRLVTDQLTVTDGRAVLPTQPGLGFQFDPDATKTYTADHPWERRER